MKKFLGCFMAGLLLSVSAWAAVDINTATQSELEAVKGIGPAKAKSESPGFNLPNNLVVKPASWTIKVIEFLSLSTTVRGNLSPFSLIIRIIN